MDYHIEVDSIRTASFVEKNDRDIALAALNKERRERIYLPLLLISIFQPEDD